MNKKIFTIFSLFVFATVFYFSGCMFEDEEPLAGHTHHGGDKDIPDARFAPDRILVTKTKTSSSNFYKEYTPEDFPEIDVVRVVEITRGTMEVIRQQLEAEKTGDWSKLQKRIDLGMLLDVNKCGIY